MTDLFNPFDAELILKKKKSLKRELLERDTLRLKKKIAILGGSTTAEIKNVLELFLLDYGFELEFYESEFAQYWQDAMLSEELRMFKPDIVFIHTSSRNIMQWPSLSDDNKKIDDMLEQQFLHFSKMWEKISQDLKCPIIQNNFERPTYRLLGNKDISDYRGKSNYISRLNHKFYEYTQTNDGFFINDIDYLSASFGLEKWADPFCWYMYKYALSTSAIPELAFSVANIIKSVFGKNKKAIAVDLDNTLWGGVVGDDGVYGLEIGQETPIGHAYSDFQTYLKELKQLGVVLSVVSKNEHESAFAGLKHPDSILQTEDFVLIKANWEPKNNNILSIIEELALLPESFVFIDDNPAERDIIRQALPEVAVPELDNIERFIATIDRCGYFESTMLSDDDAKRTEMYNENIKRAKQMATFTNYHDYLLSLDMTAIIKEFEPIYIPRITQLINKSNQFNLTTKRYTEEEVKAVTASEKHITLYGKLADKFGDNGVVSIIIGEIVDNVLNVDLWVMSCRVIKRDMELAMMDVLLNECIAKGIEVIVGHYYPTSKNNMVRELYSCLGFKKESEDETGSSMWIFSVDKDSKPMNSVIKVN